MDIERLQRRKVPDGRGMPEKTGYTDAGRSLILGFLTRSYETLQMQHFPTKGKAVGDPIFSVNNAEKRGRLFAVNNGEKTGI